MGKKVLKEQKKLIKKLIKNGLSIVKIANQVNLSYSAVYSHVKAEEKRLNLFEEFVKEKGFNSYYEYKHFQVKQNGFNSYSDYQMHLAKQNGFNSYSDYQMHLSEKRGFDSPNDQRLYLEEKNQRQSINQKFSKTIKDRLSEIEKTQEWLAEQLNINRGTISRYVRGKILPSKKVQEKLFGILRLPYKSLDDILENDFK